MVLAAGAIATLVGAIGTFLSSTVVRFVALKILLTGLFVLVLPVILNNVFHSILGELMQSALDNVDLGTTSSLRYALSGVGAYWGGLLKLPECLSIILSACACRLTLRFARLL